MHVTLECGREGVMAENSLQSADCCESCFYEQCYGLLGEMFGGSTADCVTSSVADGVAECVSRIVLRAARLHCELWCDCLADFAADCIEHCYGSAGRQGWGTELWNALWNCTASVD